MIHSFCCRDVKIRRHTAMTRSATHSLDRHLRTSRLMNKTKLRHTPIMLYGFECWAINKTDIQQTDAVDKSNCAYEEPWTFTGKTLWEMPTSSALPTSHHFHPSSSPVISLSLGILHKWMRMQMLAKLSSNLLQKTGGDQSGGREQLEWKTFIMTRLCWILGYMSLEIWPLWRLSLHSTVRS